MFNMGYHSHLHFLSLCCITLLTSTDFVYSQSSDNSPGLDSLYQSLKSQPTLDRNEIGKRQSQTLDRSRIEQLNQQAEAHQERNRRQDQKNAQLPPVSDDESGSNSSTQDEPKRNLPSREERSPAPSSSSNSGSSGKVTYDPLPEVIEFPGSDQDRAIPMTPKKSKK